MCDFPCPNVLYKPMERARHELVITILYPKFVCLNTKFLDIIDPGSQTYMGLWQRPESISPQYAPWVRAVLRDLRNVNK